MNKLVIVILGPTGVGKSSISIELAKALNGEIISADSIQIYKRLNIGSGKITQNEKQDIPHYMLDILEPTDEYSVEQFVEKTRELTEVILNKNKQPIIVGGTGLYLKSLILNYDFNNTPKNQEIREFYENIAQEKGLSFLHQKLQELWPSRALEINKNDKKRIIRALEIVNNKNRKISGNSLKYNHKYLIFALNMDREMLYDKINKRVDEMFELGLENEVRELYNDGIDENYQSMKGIGYKEFIPYFKNEISLTNVKELIKQHSRNYAKRQLTFLRSMDNINWIDVTDKKLANEKIMEIIKYEYNSK